MGIVIKGDQLNRDPWAIKFAHNLIKGSYKPITEMGKEVGISLALDAQFGAGKTTLVRSLVDYINDKEEGYGKEAFAIYYSAWDDDYTDEPFICFASEITQALVNNKILKPAKLKDAVSRFKKLSFFFAKKAGDAAVSVATAGTVQNLVSNTVDEMEGQADTTPMDEHKALKEDIEYLKDILKKASNYNQRKKIIIFVDELERCKPTYALEFLEMIKHIFNVPNITFVLSTSIDQMQHTIRQVYGQHEDMDAMGYLKRFVKPVIKLPPPQLENYIKSLLEGKDLSTFPAAQHDFLGLHNKPTRRERTEISLNTPFLIDYYVEVLQKNDISIRLIEHVFDKYNYIVNESLDEIKEYYANSPNPQDKMIGPKGKAEMGFGNIIMYQILLNIFAYVVLYEAFPKRYKDILTGEYKFFDSLLRDNFSVNKPLNGTLGIRFYDKILNAFI